MGKASRDKGKRGERIFAAICREHGYDAYRTAQVKGKDGGKPDVLWLPFLHVEVKLRKKQLQPYNYIAQAKRDAKPGMLPVVAMKRDYCGWLMVMEPDVFFEIYREYEAGRSMPDVTVVDEAKQMDGAMDREVKNTKWK